MYIYTYQYFLRKNEKGLTVFLTPRLGISRKMTWAGYVTCMLRREVPRILLGQPKVKRSLRRPRRRWEDNIKIYTIDIISLRVRKRRIKFNVQCFVHILQANIFLKYK